MSKGINKLVKFGAIGLVVYAAAEIGDCLGKAMMLRILCDPETISADEFTECMENPEEYDVHGYRAEKCKFIAKLSKMI